MLSSRIDSLARRYSRDSFAGVMLHIAIEGLDGSGKSTLVRALAGRLGDRVAQTLHLPDASCIAGVDIIAVLQHRTPPPEGHALALGFAANRLHQRQLHHASLASPHEIVLSHRDLLSGYVYQGRQGVPREWLYEVNAQCRVPDVTVFLDTPPALCAKRISDREGAPELFESGLEDLRAAFLAEIDYARKQGWVVYVVNGERPVDKIVADICGRLTQECKL